MSAEIPNITGAPIEIKPGEARGPARPAPAPPPTDLESMANLPVAVCAFGREYQISKFNVRQLAQAMTYLGPLQYVVQELGDKNGSFSKGQIASVVLGALSISGDSVIGLVSIATAEPVQWIEAQDDELGLLEVLTVTIEKNTHFFSRENMECYKVLFARIQRAIPALSGATSTPS